VVDEPGARLGNAVRSVESEANTIDAAIAQALATLGVERAQARIDILEGARPGLLGLGRRKARVRATMRPPLSAWIDAPEAPGTSEAAKPRPGGRDGDRREVRVEAVDAVHVLRDIVRMMELDATVTEAPETSAVPVARGIETMELDVTPERVLRIEGPGSTLLTARRGETLEALEHIVNRILDRAGAGDVRVVLDAGSYRVQRRTSLEAMAKRAAERVRQRGKRVTLDALAPGDRRVVYQVLHGERNVTARSVGQGFYRKVLIIPEGARRGGGKTAG
jgi:spoIIIJ-associated protein